MDDFLSLEGVRELFHMAYCAESPGIGSKKDMLERMMRKTNASLGIYIGDTPMDRDAAREAGMEFILFKGGFGGHRDMKDVKVWMNSWKELKACLEAVTRG